MRFQTNVAIYNGRFIAAPFLSVFFLLAIFLALGTLFVSLPGVRIDQADSLRPGLPRVSVVLDAEGGIHFDSKLLSLEEFRDRLGQAVRDSERAPMLQILAEGRAGTAALGRLQGAARQAGVAEIYLVLRGGEEGR